MQQLYTRNRALGAQWIRNWVQETAGLDKALKITLPYRESVPKQP